MAEEKFNQDELVPPSFITEAYIVDVIQKVEDDPELHVRPLNDTLYRKLVKFNISCLGDQL